MAVSHLHGGHRAHFSKHRKPCFLQVFLKMNKGNSGEFPLWGGLAVAILGRLLTNLRRWGYSAGIVVCRVKGGPGREVGRP